MARRDEAAGVEHVPYLLPSWRRGYVAIGLFRGAGVRAYRDLTRLVRFIRDDLRYRDPVTLHEQDCPKLSKLRSVAAGATLRSATPPSLPQATGGHDPKQDTPDT